MNIPTLATLQPHKIAKMEVNQKLSKAYMAIK
jgi:hypothetical protein